MAFKGKLKQKTGASTSEILHPETEAGVVVYSNTNSGLTATDVQSAIDEIVQSGVGVTDVKDGEGTSLVSGGIATVTPAGIGAEAAFTDGSATIASVSSDVVTIKAGVAQTGGAIGNSTASDITLAKVAKTGAYADLSGTPTIGDATLTIKAGGTSKGTFGANATSNVEIDITAADLGLSSALKFIGTAQTTVPTAGKYIQTVIGSTTYYIPVTDSGTATEIAASKGDVIVVDTKEYVCTTSGIHGVGVFQEIGDESSYALKTVTISAGTGLTGGGTLESNRTIGLADAYGDTKNPYGSKTANTVLAAPNGSNGTPSFRALVEADLPDLSGTYQTQLAATGSATKPVYVSAAGTVSEASTYAGGTKVTLNGTDQGASTASIYAPTSAITANDGKNYLVGATSTTSVAEEHTNSNVYMQNGKLYSNGSEVLTGNQTITLSGDATGSGSTSIAVTLANSGVTAGTYSAVTVNAKGLVTAGAQVFKVIENGGSTSDIATNGLYFEKDPVVDIGQDTGSGGK